MNWSHISHAFNGMIFFSKRTSKVDLMIHLQKVTHILTKMYMLQWDNIKENLMTSRSTNYHVAP